MRAPWPKASFAITASHAAADALPESCPYSLDRITSDRLPDELRCRSRNKRCIKLCQARALPQILTLSRMP
jgi:hypothetical protein